jgi:hypothetical protein
VDSPTDGRTQVDELAGRLLAGLDALPLPMPPGALQSIKRRGVGWFALAAGLAAILLGLAVALQFDATRDAAADLTKRLGVAAAPSWRGYYFEIRTSTDPAVEPFLRLMFSDGRFPGRALTDESTRYRFLPSGWSPSGEHALLTLADGAPVIGDREGRLTRIPTQLSGISVFVWQWRGDGELVTTGILADGSHALIRIDARTGMELERRRVAPGDASGVGKVSPDLRWLAFDWDGREAVTYDLETGLRASSGAPTSTVGWLGDGRLVYARYERTGSRVDRTRVYVRPPDATDGVLLGEWPGEVFAFAEPTSPYVIVSYYAGGEMWLIHPSGERVRVPGQGVPRHTFRASLSSDGRYLGFNQETDPGVRAGVVDLKTGEIRWACERACGELSIR